MKAMSLPTTATLLLVMGLHELNSLPLTLEKGEEQWKTIHTGPWPKYSDLYNHTQRAVYVCDYCTSTESSSWLVK